MWLNKEYMFNCSFFYHEEGDINIGVVAELGCTITHYRDRYYRLMAFLLAVDKINANPNILPNVTLGFTILNTHCPSYSQEIRRQRLLQFLPDSGLQYDEEYCENGNSHPVWFDVVATMISSFSGESVSYAYITALQKIPLFTSAEATVMNLLIKEVSIFLQNCIWRQQASRFHVTFSSSNELGLC